MIGAMNKLSNTSYDVVVIGAGVFGSWTAYHLQRSGARVCLLDAYGPGNSRASSGGESRVIRMCYGADELYTLSSLRSLVQWQNLFADDPGDSVDRLFYQTGVLLLARDNEAYPLATLETFQRNNIVFEKLDRAELVRRYPQLELGPNTWGILEPQSGVLMARQAVRRVVSRAIELGVEYSNEAVGPPESSGKLELIKTSSGRSLSAGNFIFASGPWLPKIFPRLLAELIHVTRQEEFFFGVPANDPRFDCRVLPIWIDFADLVYSIPNVDGRGLKVAIDAHGSDFDPDTGDRIPTTDGISAARRCLATRLPALKNAPIVESRVCQYENTSNGDFLIDLHPDYQNVWIVGGGSGHGFKHGPAVGEYVAGRISGVGRVEPRFSLGIKTAMRQRQVF
jgi:monomeric sarcosine oxidase